MRTRTLPGWIGLLAGCIAAGTATGVGYAPELIYLMDVHPGVAGWVQAIGSIGAIIGAVFVANLQAAADRKARREAAKEERRRRSRMAIALSSLAHVRMSLTLKMLLNTVPTRDSSFWLGHLTTVESTVEVLAGFEVAELIDPRPIEWFTIVRSFLRMAADAVRPLAVGEVSPAQRKLLIASAVAKLSPAVQMAGGVCAQLQEHFAAHIDEETIQRWAAGKPDRSDEFGEF